MRAALAIGPIVFSLVVTVLTWSALESLASRRASFWHVAEVPRIGPPVGSASHRPMESPDPGVGRNQHFMYLDRRPQRERLLPTYVAPDAAREVPSGAIVVWSAASALLTAGAVTAFAMASAPPGVIMVLLAVLFATMATRGLVQRARLRSRPALAAQLAESASTAQARAQELTELGDTAGARLLLEETADELHDLAPASGDPMRVLTLADELRSIGRKGSAGSDVSKQGGNSTP